MYNWCLVYYICNYREVRRVKWNKYEYKNVYTNRHCTRARISITWFFSFIHYCKSVLNYIFFEFITPYHGLFKNIIIYII